MKKNEFGIHNSPYEAEAINAAIEASELHHGYMKALREICEQYHYNFHAFRRWLLRNNIKSRTSKYSLLRYRTHWKNYAQITVNITVEEKVFLSKYLAEHKISRKEFVNKAVKAYIKSITDAEYTKTPR